MALTASLVVRTGMRAISFDYVDSLEADVERGRDLLCGRGSLPATRLLSCAQHLDCEHKRLGQGVTRRPLEAEP